MAGGRFRTVERNLDAIGPFADDLRNHLQKILDEEGVACVELAVVEALTNAILFNPATLADPISVYLQVTETDVTVEIDDGAAPVPGLFDGAGAEMLDFDPTDRQNIPESGRGLSLIVVSMDEVRYRNVGDRTRLSMKRRR